MEIMRILFFIIALALFIYGTFFWKVDVAPLGELKTESIGSYRLNDLSSFEGVVNDKDKLYEKANTRSRTFMIRETLQFAEMEDGNNGQLDKDCKT